ncbi:MAG TPA: type II toxin-antitoxin system VapC family toxin [archaeon]|nr:type II toxin-antitoxin system VapC family toxin [archaeon]
MRVYLDSNVFISLFEREMGKNSRGLFVEAEMFLERVKNKGSVLVLSDWFFREVQKITFLSKGEVLRYLENNGAKTEVVDSEGVSLEKTGELHFPDSMHAAIAIHFGCGCIVTFNLKDFEKVKRLIEILEPGEY